MADKVWGGVLKQRRAIGMVAGFSEATTEAKAGWN